eukprot:TRINITY_DN22701_c0_g1_i1.p1 TRINITY_DN22701_c0_g1~~TRINITY_DN22701_c0_g1_i1.p1  ORF type:complete len:484 (+),score=135.84 TRINITY_DN22701_c0_g1_i1:88-1452(+)
MWTTPQHGRADGALAQVTPAQLAAPGEGRVPPARPDAPGHQGQATRRSCSEPPGSRGGGALRSPSAPAAAAPVPTADSERDAAEKQAAPSPRSASRGELVWAIAVFGFSAVGMTTGNKMAVEHLRHKETDATLPATLVLMQMLGTLLLLFLNRQRIDPALISVRHAWKWLPIFICSATGMYTSAKSFVYVNVSFVIIMRNCGTLLTTAAEFVFRKQVASTQTIVAEAVILAGIVIYGRSMIHFKDFWPGLFWCTANTVVITGWSVLLKYRLDTDPEVKELNKFAMSLYNNAMGVPYFVAAAVSGGEHLRWAVILPNVTTVGWLVVLATCGIGFMISTSGFALTRIVSATTYNIINNLVKVVNILFGLVFLGDTFPGIVSILGCVIALGGGAWYSMHVLREREQKETEPCQPVRVVLPIFCLCLIVYGAAWLQQQEQHALRPLSMPQGSSPRSGI